MKLILILEDEPFIAIDLKYACEDEGLGAVTAGNVRQAMTAMDERSGSWHHGPRANS